MFIAESFSLSNTFDFSERMKEAARKPMGESNMKR